MDRYPIRCFTLSMDQTARLALSLRTVLGWEAVLPSGRFADTLRMIREELRLLGTISDPAARDIEERYLLLAEQLDYEEALRLRAETIVGLPPPSRTSSRPPNTGRQRD